MTSVGRVAVSTVDVVDVVAVLDGRVPATRTVLVPVRFVDRVVLVGLGATTLSMTPAALADVRAELGNHTLEQAREMATAALAASTAAAAKSAAAAVHAA